MQGLPKQKIVVGGCLGVFAEFLVLLLQICACLGSARAGVSLRSQAGQHRRKGSKACWCCRCFCGCDTANLSSLATCATGQPANWWTGLAEVQADPLQLCERLPLLQSWWWQLGLVTAPSAAAGPAAWQGLLLPTPFLLEPSGMILLPAATAGPSGCRQLQLVHGKSPVSLPSASAPSTAVRAWSCSWPPLLQRQQILAEGKAESWNGLLWLGPFLTGVQFLQGSQIPYMGLLQFISRL